MALVAVRRGYVETRVEDVLAAARASRRTFYGYFDNREECLLASYDAIRDDAFLALTNGGDDLERALVTLFEYFNRWPAHARLLTSEILAAGPAGLRRHEQTMSELARRLRHCTRWPASSPSALPPDDLAHALVGGVHRVVHRRLVTGQAASLLGLAPALAALAQGGPHAADSSGEP